MIFDVSDLDAPTFTAAHEGATPAIDHDTYVRDGPVCQSNYAAGVLDTTRAAQGELPEVAFFDIFPGHDRPEFVGTCSNHPCSASGTIAVTGFDEGLFLLKAQPQVLAQHATRR